MGSGTYIRSIEASERRQQREAQRRQRELDRQAKEQAKLSAIEQARLEVDTYQNRVELLLSVHKEQGQVWDWPAVLALLLPPTPQHHSYHELAVRRRACLVPAEQESNSEAATLQARLEDDREYHQALETHTQESADQAKLKALALRVIAGDLKAYTEALVELSPLGEISTLGSTIHFTAHSPHLLEATLRVDGIQAIPAEVKSLTASDKLSVKPMPKARFHEIYQDYICGCILRVAREVFALLPVSSLLITASADAADPVTGRPTEEPVLSAAITRDSMLQVDFEHLDPSDIMDRFPHRGEFRTSRNTGTFATIIPLTPEDVPPTVARHSDKRDLLAEVRQVRADLHTEIALFEPPLVPR